ncbi:MAG: galactose-1-phosphate uridylyltransferase [candidate division Zixibacteria bacterium]|nr:galactose-1-phosphate uridylyltransferase [candidate division Zixibacteria bacterium]
MPELRRDPVSGRWVIIATERGKRPSDYPSPPPRKMDSKFCPFCPGNEAATPPEVWSLRAPGTGPNEPGWTVRAIPNKYPALRIEGELNREGVGIYDKMNGIGAHEVVIETPHHHENLVDLSTSRIADVMAVCQERVNDLIKDDRFRYVMLFKNQGESAGASLEHSHTQLIATPVVPKRVLEEMEGAKRYYADKERCIFCDILRQERSDGERIVDQSESFIAYAPFASRFPFEVWIVPRPHQPVFRSMGEAHRLEFAEILRRTLLRIKFTLNNPDYNYMFHSAPFGHETTSEYHWHLEIIPKLTRVAGFEWGTGFYINPTSPEEAAECLRNARLDEGTTETPVPAGAAEGIH